ncbi:hypothetical protein ON010_g2737 [Phytophthora cinnamomi]|nr:hypothetical protein ON010_g2737 [Phytophthora cinnamomi]
MSGLALERPSPSRYDWRGTSYFRLLHATWSACDPDRDREDAHPERPAPARGARRQEPRTHHLEHPAVRQAARAQGRAQPEVPGEARVVAAGPVALAEQAAAPQEGGAHVQPAPGPGSGHGGSGLRALREAGAAALRHQGQPQAVHGSVLPPGCQVQRALCVGRAQTRHPAASGGHRPGSRPPVPRRPHSRVYSLRAAFLQPARPDS